MFIQGGPFCLLFTLLFFTFCNLLYTVCPVKSCQGIVTSLFVQFKTSSLLLTFSLDKEKTFSTKDLQGGKKRQNLRKFWAEMHADRKDFSLSKQIYRDWLLSCKPYIYPIYWFVFIQYVQKLWQRITGGKDSFKSDSVCQSFLLSLLIYRKFHFGRY